MAAVPGNGDIRKGTWRVRQAAGEGGSNDKGRGMEKGQMTDSKPAEEEEEATVTYVVNAESWGQVIATTTLWLMDEYKANSAMLDQTLADIESAEHANMNTLAAVRSSLSSANLK